MKIIGTTDNGYIIEINKTEAANMAGAYSSFSDECKDWKIGSVISIGRIYGDAKEAVDLMSGLKSSIEALNKQTTSMLKKVEIKEKTGKQ